MARGARAPAAAFCLAVAVLGPDLTPTTAGQPLGAIEGRVTYDGPPPEPTFVVQGGRTQPVLYVDSSGGLQYALVFLDASRGGAASTVPAILNQRDFIFEPQVLAVEAGRPVRFTSDDSANHNVRSDATGPNAFSVNTAAGAPPPPPHRFARTPPDRPVVLSCDIHPWMIAWVYAFDREMFAVTDARGRFRLENVPSGRHRLGVRQPAGGLTRDMPVHAEAGRTTTIEIRFTRNDLAVPAR